MPSLPRVTAADSKPWLALLASLALAFSTAAHASRETCPDRSSDEHYFPAATFAADAGGDDAFVRGWYSKHLRAMGEPSLSCGATGRVYRFTWLRSFDHPVAVRITDRGRGGLLEAVELDGAGGYAPGSVLRRKSYVLGERDMARLRMAMAPAWNLDATADDNGRDGAEWIIELAEDGRHHAVTRWSPREGLVRELGLRLLSMSGWKFKKGETY
jgi:hypothetical protein